MYSYTYDTDTGGLLLNFMPTGTFSKEPRPVYAPELDLLGFNKFWNYDKQTDFPYMWAEANVYFYRGEKIAKLKGGNIFNAPELIIEENFVLQTKLIPIDLKTMVEKNQEVMNFIENETAKKILNVYKKHKNKLDCFHVAFSGGKDSCVLLDLVKKTLPKGSYAVVFGDTGMEFPDTYDVVAKTQEMCKKEDIPFYIAKSHLSPEESWKMFGPPSRTLRWCCSVHKTTPQILKLREITGKTDYKGLAFVGVRKYESINRSEYGYEGFDTKQKGQYSHNSLIEWESSEIWLYMYSNNIGINEAYKKGNKRAGCVCCPMGVDKAGYILHINYGALHSIYMEKIKKSHEREILDIHAFLSGGWTARSNGRDLADNPSRYQERIDGAFLVIETNQPFSDIQEWVKTVPIDKSLYNLEKTSTGILAKVSRDYIKDNPTIGKLFRQAIKKSSFCQGCRTCEANCLYKAITFNNNKINIKNCVKCGKCHEITEGCLIFQSRKHPEGGGKNKMSLNILSTHAPKTEWFRAFFEKKNDFFKDNALGPVQYDVFTRVLKHAELATKNQILPLCDLLGKIGWDCATSQGIILINLVTNNHQIEWYVKSFDIDKQYGTLTIDELLIAEGVKPLYTNPIRRAYEILTETPLGLRLNFGRVISSKKNTRYIRTKCYVPDNRVILYGLYKFAEKCGDYKEFTLSILLDDNIERAGISPTRIFGIEREEMRLILNMLSVNYRDFISFIETSGLENITLSSERTSEDVLQLFWDDIKDENKYE
ncbi:MAG: phosphoadenosine phosphosulfate reductase family protein [Candidatus Cloacimonetes bacterium]|nr:phosphoadenosine phosphosulfate reductase family protein [Candidatus Cloacimonadota bacterium]